MHPYSMTVSRCEGVGRQNQALSLSDRTKRFWLRELQRIDCMLARRNVKCALTLFRQTPAIKARGARRKRGR